MFDFNIEQWVPKFILNDTNGYAIAKAIEVAMRTMNSVVAEGLACISDFDTMPEWRLDELAWEYNCLYDYNAYIEVKRDWIKNASRFYLTYGTPAGIVQYLQGVYGSVSVEEASDYGADPYHFRVIVTGEWSQASDEWAQRAVEATKNVRSVLDGIIFNSGSAEILMHVAAAVCGIEITYKTNMLG